MEKYSSYTWKRIKCNPLIQGFLLSLETLLWYLWRENLYIICEVSQDRATIKEKELNNEEKKKELRQFKYANISDEPSRYIVLNSNKDTLYKISTYNGMVLIRLGKAYRGILTSKTEKGYIKYWINEIKVQKNMDNLERLKDKALMEYNALYNGKYIEKLF